MQVKNYVACVNFGDKYGPEYNKKLYEMVSDNCTIPFTFLTITDDHNKSDRHGTTFVPEHHYTGWWNKMHLYRPDLPVADGSNILYLDLDVVITSNIDKLFTYASDNWATINDFIRLRREMNPPTMYNSSVVRFTKGQLAKVWQEFIKNPQTKGGDQNFLHKVMIDTNPATFFPDEWIRSYRWDLEENGLGKETCIAVFHGTPNPLDKEVLEKEEWVRKAMSSYLETEQAD